MKNFSIILVVLFSAISVCAQNFPMKISGYTQGSTYHITYYDSLHRDFQKEIDQLLKQFDESLSTYLPSSVISKINANEKNVVVDDYFITCFNKAKEIWKNTEGAFDPTVYPLVNAWGFGPGKKQKIDKLLIDSLLTFVGFHLIELKGHRIEKKDLRVSLDFNAFAQGYAVDLVSDFLVSKHINAFIVEIGGEVYAKGKKFNGDNWTVGIEQPIDNKETENPLKAIAKLENLAIATSGNYRRFTIENGIKYAHHIDPKTGYPTKDNLLSVSVFSDKCIVSDAYATGLLVMGLEKAKEYLNKHRDLEAYLIYADEQGNFKIYETPGLKTLIVNVD